MSLHFGHTCSQFTHLYSNFLYCHGMGIPHKFVLSQLAMLGFALAVFGELTTGRNIYEQVAHAPARVALVFLLFIVATVVPIVRGVPRRGNAIFTPDAELINGR